MATATLFERGTILHSKCFGSLYAWPSAQQLPNNCRLISSTHLVNTDLEAAGGMRTRSSGCLPELAPKV